MDEQLWRDVYLLLREYLIGGSTSVASDGSQATGEFISGFSFADSDMSMKDGVPVIRLSLQQEPERRAVTVVLRPARIGEAVRVHPMLRHEGRPEADDIADYLATLLMETIQTSDLSDEELVIE